MITPMHFGMAASVAKRPTKGDAINGYTVEQVSHVPKLHRQKHTGGNFEEGQLNVRIQESPGQVYTFRRVGGENGNWVNDSFPDAKERASGA